MPDSLLTRGEGLDHISGTRASIFIPFFVVITGFNDNDNMMLVVYLVVVFMVNFAMNKMVFRVMNE